jgi:hypothetical protein
MELRPAMDAIDDKHWVFVQNALFDCMLGGNDENGYRGARTMRAITGSAAGIILQHWKWRAEPVFQPVFLRTQSTNNEILQPVSHNLCGCLGLEFSAISILLKRFNSARCGGSPTFAPFRMIALTVIIITLQPTLLTKLFLES